MFVNPYKSLSNQEIESNLLRFAGNERVENVDIILHLLLVKERKIYVPAGHDSVFAYCRGKLGFSRATSYRRKAVVEKVEEFPDLLERLRDGRLQLCAAAAIATHLRKETAEELLDAVTGLSHSEVETFMVRQWRTKTTAASAGKASSSSLSAETSFSLSAETPLAGGLRFETTSTSDSLNSLAARSTPKAPPLPRTVVRPLSPEASRVSVTLSDKTLENLRRAKEVLGGRSEDEILFRALEKLLDQVAPERRHARREKKRTQKAEKMKDTQGCADQQKKQATSRRGRLADRDKVMVDGDCRCSFVSKEGKRCDARVFLEIDHIKPWALGGLSTVENEQLLCRTHNVYRSEQTFGLWGHDG